MLDTGPSAPGAVKRTAIRWDVLVSVTALAAVLVTVAFGVVRLAEVATRPGVCPSPVCSTPAVLVSVVGPVVVAVAAGFAGAVVTVLRIVDRRVSWPFAVATLLLCGVAVGLGEYASLAAGW